MHPNCSVSVACGLIQNPLQRGSGRRTGTSSPLGMCGRRYCDVGEDGYSYGAKRLECVQLAGAIVKCGRSESGSKLRALQTLRAQERPHRATIRHWTYDPEHLGSAEPTCLSGVLATTRLSSFNAHCF